MSYSASILSLFAATADSTDPILTALYGGGGAADADPLQALQNAERNETQDVAQTAAQPAIARDIATFTSAVNSATSPAQLLANPTVLKVLLTASGLGSQVGYTALATQALLSNSSDSSSLVNQLSSSNAAWLTVNQTYNFATKGLSVIQTPKVIADIANGYVEQSWLQSVNATTPGLGDALTFRAEASGITSVDQLLGDPVLRSVVTTALGIPEQIAFQDLHAQEQSITSQISISQFKDASFVNNLTDRYLLAMQQQAGDATGSSDISSLAIQAQGLVV